MSGIVYLDSRRFKGVIEQTDEALEEINLQGTYGVRKYYTAEKMELGAAQDRSVNIVLSTQSIDRDNDTIDPNGFLLDNFRKNPVVLFAHDNTQPPIARAENIQVGGGKLSAKTVFMPHDLSPFSDTIYRMIGAKFLNAASVGFLPLEYNQVKRDGVNGGRKGDGFDFAKQELLEYSIVPVPSNPEALVGAKAAGIDTRHLLEWYEKALSDWATHKGMLLVPKSVVEKAIMVASTKKIYTPAPEEQDSLLAKNLARIKATKEEAMQGALGADDLHTVDQGGSNPPPATNEEYLAELGKEPEALVIVPEDQPHVIDKGAPKKVDKSGRFLPHIADRVFNRPLIIQPARLQAIMSVLGGRVGLDDHAVEAMFGDISLEQPKAARKQYTVNKDGIAIIPVHGTLVQRNGGSLAYCGLCGYDGLSKVFDETLADVDVKAIAFEFDSGGGEVAGCFPLVDKIYTARGVKPIWAVVNENAYSAAYALASACDKIVVAGTGGVGSVGVVTMHADVSKHLDQEGFKITLIHSGSKKVDGNPYVPLPDDVKNAIQTDIDQVYNIFVKAVARNRGISEDVIRGTEAGLVGAYEADNKGFYDEVCEFEPAMVKMAALTMVVKEPEKVEPKAPTSMFLKINAAGEVFYDDPVTGELRPFVFDQAHKSAVQEAIDPQSPEVQQIIREVSKEVLATFAEKLVSKAVAKARGRIG